MQAPAALLLYVCQERPAKSCFQATCSDPTMQVPCSDGSVRLGPLAGSDSLFAHLHMAFTKETLPSGDPTQFVQPGPGPESEGCLCKCVHQSPPPPC